MHLENVNEDPIVIVNGFRVCWIVAPEHIVRMLASAGSF